jgi:NSS family neurotransmitter:Na+ symporter
MLFFTIGVCMGVLTSFASYNKKDKPVLVDSYLVPILNSCVSFFAGFAVFETIGHLAYIDSPVQDQTSSYALAFVAYPSAMNALPGKNFWNFTLFLILFSLGLDSAFSYVEAFSTVIYDATFRNSSKKY